MSSIEGEEIIKLVQSPDTAFVNEWIVITVDVAEVGSRFC